MRDSTTDSVTGSEHPNTTAEALRRRTFLVGAAGVATAGATGIATGQSEEGREKDRGHGNVTENDPNLIAHRGFAGLYPENTVGAVENASRGGRSDQAPSRGADWIEIDVVPTADEDVVVFHDDGLAERDGGERGLTDTAGLVWETDTETVTNAEVLDSGETVPLLTEVMDAIPANVGVNVELKNPGSQDLRFAQNLSSEELTDQKTVWQSFVEDVVAVVDEYNNDILFSSFYEAALAVTRDISAYPVAPLLWDSIEDGLNIARTYDAEAIHPPFNMIKETPFFTEGSEWADIDLVAFGEEQDVDVNVYTLDMWYQAEQLTAAGVDGLITDHPDVLRFGAQ